MQCTPLSRDLQRARIARLEGKIDKLIEAIESIGISDTLAERLRGLESEKRGAETRLAQLSADRGPLEGLPDLIPTIMEIWRRLVAQIEALPDNPHARPSEIEAARKHLGALLGKVEIRARRGVPWAFPTLKTQGLPEASPLICGSGGRLATLSSVDHGAGYSLKRATLEDGQRAAERALTTFGAACAHPHSPMTFQVALPGMELPTRYVHVLGAPRNIQSLVLTGQLGGVS